MKKMLKINVEVLKALTNPEMSSVNGGGYIGVDTGRSKPSAALSDGNVTYSADGS